MAGPFLFRHCLVEYNRYWSRNHNVPGEIPKNYALRKEDKYREERKESLCQSMYQAPSVR